jgi:hypothetical protein
MQNFRHFYSATLIKLAANRSNLLVPFLPVRRRRVGDGTVELMIALAASALVRPAEAPNDELVIVVVNTTSPSPKPRCHHHSRRRRRRDRCPCRRPASPPPPPTAVGDATGIAKLGVIVILVDPKVRVAEERPEPIVGKDGRGQLDRPDPLAALLGGGLLAIIAHAHAVAEGDAAGPLPLHQLPDLPLPVLLVLEGVGHGPDAVVEADVVEEASM